MNIKIRHKSFEYYLGAATPCMFSLSAIFWRKHCIRSGSYSVLYILLLLGLPILHLGYSYIVLPRLGMSVTSQGGSGRQFVTGL